MQKDKTMRIWRLLVSIGKEVWTFVVVAPEHGRAWEVVLDSLPRAARSDAELEELEASGERRATGCSRLLHRWRTAPDAGDTEPPTDASGTASTAA